MLWSHLLRHWHSSHRNFEKVCIDCVGIQPNLNWDDKARAKNFFALIFTVLCAKGHNLPLFNGYTFKALLWIRENLKGKTKQPRRFTFCNVVLWIGVHLELNSELSIDLYSSWGSENN